MTITAITRPNKGLGYESAGRLIELGQALVIGARDGWRGQTGGHDLGARFVSINATDDTSDTASRGRGRD